MLSLHTETKTYRLKKWVKITLYCSRWPHSINQTKWTTENWRDGDRTRDAFTCLSLTLKLSALLLTLPSVSQNTWRLLSQFTMHSGTSWHSLPAQVIYCCSCWLMVTLCNRTDHIYFHHVVCSSSSSSSSFFSSPNLSGRRLDVCHTSTHGVALVRI